MTSGDTCRETRRRSSPARVQWAAALVSIYLVGAIAFAVSTPFPTEFDELAHLSYIKAMAEQPALFASHETLRLLDAERLSAWSDQNNYLSHPTAYYLMMSPLVGDRITPFDLTLLRLVNTGIGMATILAVMGMLWVRIESDAAFVGGAALIALCPMANVVSASVGNDALTVLAGALALFACLRWLERGPRPGSVALAGLAFALAALTKLNAGLLVGVVLVVVYAATLRSAPWRGRHVAGHVAIAIPFGLVGMAPYAVNLWRFAAPIHVDLDFHVAQITGRDPWSFSHYAMWFFEAMGRTWSAYEPADAIEMGGLVLLLALAVWACRSGVARPMRDMARATLAAIAVVLPIHLAFSYQLHLQTLHLSAAQSRYYLALVPMLAFAAAGGLDSLKNARWRHIWAGLAVAVSLYASLIPAALRTYLDWRG